MGCLSILYGNNFKYSTEILFPLAVIHLYNVVSIQPVHFTGELSMQNCFGRLCSLTVKL